MKSYSVLFLLLFSLLIKVENVCAKPEPLVFTSGKLEITLHDHLHHPYYWWPSTLLNYPVIFDQEPRMKELTLTDKNKQLAVPFQMSELEKLPNGKFLATLSFISDLPSGEKKTFTLQKNNPAKDFPDVKVTEAKEFITIQTDKLSVHLPASQGSSIECPGPVLGLTDRQGKWIGTSKLETSGKKLSSITTRPVSVGPLFAEYEVKYTFEDGASYNVEIKCIMGYDFFEIRERMSGFTNAGTAYWEINWNGFSPTHRQAPNRPYFQVERGGNVYVTQTENPGFGRFNWEPIDQTMMSSHHGIKIADPNGKLPFQIDIYGNYPAEATVTSSLFWDEKAMQSLGIFMNDASCWNDHLYPIWHISGKSSVGFYYLDKQLIWRYPLHTGTRATAISCYSHENDISYMDGLEKLYQPQTHPYGFTYRAHMPQLSHNSYLQNRYGTIHLDKIKDWVLSYPDSLPLGSVVIKDNRYKTVKDLEQGFLYHHFVLELPVAGTCQNTGYGPTRNRMFYGSWVGGFNNLLPVMSEQERERFISMFLFHCYVAAGEDYMPMRSMLSGHPNFLADVKSTPVMAAFLFPEHPEAKTWEEMFAKYVELNTHYHTRPDVQSWDATGGRWTENLGTYVWAFLKPTIYANLLIKNNGSGRNFLAGKNQAMIGSWLLNSLSAPYNGESLDHYKTKDGEIPSHFWGIVTKDGGPSRVHPPQGAHAARRKAPSDLWVLGQMLKNYDPLLSENISFVSSPRDGMSEGQGPIPGTSSENNVDKGTPPDFQSVKFTGYGTILRAGVGTENELSVHLSQIDQGHNYRWGNVAQGGTGTIYFYAAGKSYSHNGREDAGDRRVQDTDLITNFGVFKENTFKSIGQNVLSKPLYDLEVGQFTEIVTSKDNPYSWPEYQGRSIMLVGSDYFIVYDDVFTDNISSRFSWFTHPLEDLPFIQILKAGKADYVYKPGDATKTEIFGPESKGVWYDGSGDFMVLVSHKDGFKSSSMKNGTIIENSVGGKDYIFRNDTPVTVDEPTMVFSGEAGFIRQRKDGVNEMAIFKGTRIGNEKFVIESMNPQAGISSVMVKEDRIEGRYYSYENSQLTFRWRKVKPAGINFYLNGVKQAVSETESGFLVDVPAGAHIWNIGISPLPARPEIQSTRNEKGRVLLNVNPVPGAESYRYEYSTDAGKSWIVLKEQTKPGLMVKASANETKGFVRVTAFNKEYSGKASVIYPIYFTNEKPDHPDGLKLTTLNDNEVDLSWGKVLGCDRYRLYRRTRGGNEKYALIKEMNGNQFSDKTIQAKDIYEYAVSSVNGNGEGERCYPVTNDPGSWLNFDPMPGEPFRRTGLPAIGNNVSTEIYYPE